MFKSFVVYRIVALPVQFSVEGLAQALSTRPFTPCAPSEKFTAGWVPPRNDEHAALVEAQAGHCFLQMRTQNRVLPASAVKEELAAEMARIEKATGRKPRGQAKRDLKETIEQQLLPRAFTKTASTLVWLDCDNMLMYIATTSSKRADAITTELVALLEGDLKLQLVQTVTSPAMAMAMWLHDQEPPTGFSIDDECELRQQDEGKATVRYSRHSLDNPEVIKHIEQGKMPTQLAMSLGARISFVLTDALQLKRVKLLDMAIQDNQSAGNETAGEGAAKDDNFDADMALVTGELSLLMPALLEALGGEVAAD